MNKWSGNYANESLNFTWKNPVIIKVKAIRQFNNFDQPQNEYDNGRWNEAQDEPFVFDVGF